MLFHIHFEAALCAAIIYSSKGQIQFKILPAAESSTLFRVTYGITDLTQRQRLVISSNVGVSGALPGLRRNLPASVSQFIFLDESSINQLYIINYTNVGISGAFPGLSSNVGVSGALPELRRNLPASVSQFIFLDESSINQLYIINSIAC